MKNYSASLRPCLGRRFECVARFHRGFCSALLLAVGLAFALGGAGVSVARAQVVFNEGSMGDFSNSGLAPTFVSVNAGSNLIFGTTGRGAAGIDRDYFTITIPTGFAFTALLELPGTTVGGPVSFLGLQAGSQVTLPTNAATATGLLGWTHYGSAVVATNLFPTMSIPLNGSSGFTAPLGAGSYSFWVQDFNTGSFNYGFDVQVTAVPEPSTYAAAGSALLLMLVLRRRFAKSGRV